MSWCLYQALWLCAAVEGVEPTNNHAKRLLRLEVLQRKSTFSCHNAAGCRFAERMLTMVQAGLRCWITCVARVRLIGPAFPPCNYRAKWGLIDYYGFLVVKRALLAFVMTDTRFGRGQSAKSWPSWASRLFVGPASTGPLPDQAACPSTRAATQTEGSR